MTNYTHQALKNYEPPIFYHTYIQYKEQKSYFKVILIFTSTFYHVYVQYKE